jgi:hypothetical protein
MPQILNEISSILSIIKIKGFLAQKFIYYLFLILFALNSIKENFYEEKTIILLTFF